MKSSSATTPTRLPSLQVAWGLLTTNLGLPGVGSLLAGRKVGVFQLILSISALILTTVFGVKFAVWYFTNREQLSDPNADPFAMLKALWLAVRWALLGMVLFGVSVCWALVTSWDILRAARQAAPPSHKNEVS